MDYALCHPWWTRYPYLKTEARVKVNTLELQRSTVAHIVSVYENVRHLQPPQFHVSP